MRPLCQARGGHLPSGRLVLRAERVGGREVDPVQQLAELGITAGGVLERRHPTSGELRRTVWLGE